jgi:hypothetical protein
MSDFFGDASDDEFDEDEFGAELAEATTVHCPYCGEAVEMFLDAAGGEVQEYVEDCEVCCRPWSVRVTIDSHGVPNVDLHALNE